MQQKKQATIKDHAMVGAVKVQVSSVSNKVFANAAVQVKVSSVSDKMFAYEDPLGISTLTPNTHEEPDYLNAIVLVLNPSDSEGATFASRSNNPNTCIKETTKTVTNTDIESKGNVETSAKETTPILDLSQNSLEKSLLEKSDVINTLSSSDKSGEDPNSNSNKKATINELEIRNSIDPIDKEITPQLDLNQINSEGLLSSDDNVEMDISTHHSKPASVRTSNRKKQSPLTRNEDFLWK